MNAANTLADITRYVGKSFAEFEEAKDPQYRFTAEDDGRL